jgi:molybdopterin/thiamine biosynthesis adenylyltransferase
MVEAEENWRDRVRRDGATVLNENVRADAELLDRIRASTDIEVTDLRGRQREWLQRLIPAPSADLVDESQRWAYYPWRRALVGIVGPRSYRCLRLDRNRNKISSAEQNRFADLKIGVVGLSVGHAIAYALALEGLCGELRLADFDEIELPNLNRIPGTVFDLGVNKAVVAARRISEIDPYLKTSVYPSGYDASMSAEFLDGLDLVIEESDSLEAKIRVRTEARSRGIPVIMETNDRGMLDVERFDLEPDRPLFHGLLGDISPEDVRGLTAAEALPYITQLTEIDKVSERMLASVGEIGRTISSYPQLGSDTLLGGVSVAAAVRRFGLGEPLPSGRVRIDVWELLGTLEDPASELARWR